MSIEEKQNFLRTQIIERGISTDVFFEYWQKLDLELDDVSMETLSEVVEKFLDQLPEKANQQKEQKEQQPAQEDEEEQFSDFQEAQAGQVKHEVKNEYADFNWDFLNTKKHQDHLVQTSVVSSNSTPNKKYLNESLMSQQTPPKKQEKISVSQRPVKEDIKAKPKQVTKTPKKRQQKPKETKNQDLLEQLHQGSAKKTQQLPGGGNPKEQRSMTVKEVLESSKLNRLKCLKLQQNVLSHHTGVQILITKVEEVEEKNNNIINKFMKKTDNVFTIKTVARNKNRSIGISWQVKRNTKDFEWLRGMLVKFYPGLVVPPLPAATTSKERIFGYQKKLQHFLLDCCRCPQLKNSTYYQNFLSYSNRNSFDEYIKNSITASKPKYLSHIINMTGYIDTLYSDSIETYGEGLQQYIGKTTNHLKHVNQILNDINQAYDHISELYRDLANQFYQMSDESHSFSDEKCYERLTKTYKQVAVLTEEHSTFCQIQKDFIDAFMKSHFAYQKIRLQNMQGLISKRATFAHELSKRSKQQDSGKGMFGKLTSLFGQKTQYVDTPSSSYDILNSQVGYYNNQLLQESVRCVEVMIQSHVNHFAGYGHSRIDNVDNMQKIWSKQLVQLSKLALTQ